MPTVLIRHVQVQRHRYRSGKYYSQYIISIPKEYAEKMPKKVLLTKVKDCIIIAPDIERLMEVVNKLGL